MCSSDLFNIAKSLLVSENMQLIIDTYYSRNNLGEYSGETGKSEVSINKATIEAIIAKYTREAGVRNLRRVFSKLFRKVVKQILEDM